MATRILSWFLVSLMAMGTLYLLRHAKSSWDDPALDDHERPLSARGWRNAAALAEHVRAERIVPALILCSTARRARETLAAMVPALDGEVAIRIESDLYAASSSSLLARLKTVPDATESVMLIGHNPAIEGLAVLLASDETPERMPTGALVALTSTSSWAALGERACQVQSVTIPR
jgi:phosphohistidine phosphatase